MSMQSAAQSYFLLIWPNYVLQMWMNLKKKKKKKIFSQERKKIFSQKKKKKKKRREADDIRQKLWQTQASQII